MTTAAAGNAQNVTLQLASLFDKVGVEAFALNFTQALAECYWPSATGLNRTSAGIPLLQLARDASSAGAACRLSIWTHTEKSPAGASHSICSLGRRG